MSILIRVNFETKTILSSETISDNDDKLNRIIARFNNKSITKLILSFQNESNPSYMRHSKINFPIPNFESKPTGVIGKRGISETFPNSLKKTMDYFAWLDHKYQSTLNLVQKHKDANMSLVINTSSDLIGHDDYIAAMPKNTVVNMYLLPKHAEYARMLFPGNPSRARQITAVQKLQSLGITVNVIEPTIESVRRCIGLKEMVKRTACKSFDHMFIESIERIVS